MKGVLLIIMTMFMVIPVKGEWNKKDRNSFSSASEYRYIFDMSNTNYNGLDSIDFVEYNAVKSNVPIEKYRVILKYLGAEVSDELSDRAGMKVTVNTYCNEPGNGCIYKFQVGDGRWNNFDILLQENAEELADKIVNNTEFKRSLFKSVRRGEIDDIYL